MLLLALLRNVNKTFFLLHFKWKIGSINKAADCFLYSAGTSSYAPTDKREFCLHILHKVVQQTSNELIPGSQIQCVQWTTRAFPGHHLPLLQASWGTLIQILVAGDFVI